MAGNKRETFLPLILIIQNSTQTIGDIMSMRGEIISDEYQKMVFVHDKDGNLVYGNAPGANDDALPNDYNLRVVNPVQEDILEVLYDQLDVPEGVYQVVTIYDKDGNRVFYGSEVYPINQYNTYFLNPGEVHTVELSLDGVVNARQLFYYPKY